jgi:hypothetical protein
MKSYQFWILRLITIAGLLGIGYVAGELHGYHKCRREASVLLESSGDDATAWGTAGPISPDPLVVPECHPAANAYAVKLRDGAWIQGCTTEYSVAFDNTWGVCCSLDFKGKKREEKETWKTNQ